MLRHRGGAVAVVASLLLALIGLVLVALPGPLTGVIGFCCLLLLFRCCPLLVYQRFLLHLVISWRPLPVVSCGLRLGTCLRGEQLAEQLPVGPSGFASTDRLLLEFGLVHCLRLA